MRLAHPVLRRMLRTWLAAVCSLMTSSAPISRLESPRVTSRRISTSRCESPSGRGGGAAEPSARVRARSVGMPSRSASAAASPRSRAARSRSPAAARRSSARAYSYPALQCAFDDFYCPGLQWYWRHDFVRELPDAAIERHVEFGARLPTVHSTVHLYPVDGAVHDVAPDATAFRFRDAQFSQVMVGVDPDPAKAAELRSFAVDYWEAMHPYSAGAAYVNMMMEEGADRVRASYGDNYERLARVKAAYDPDNVFRLNQNIAPAG